LDGVPEQQANYRSMGFLSDYETFRWSGRLKGRPNPAISVFGKADLPALIEFDSRYFAEKRKEFLRNWLALPRQTRVFIRNGSIAGYAVSRQCHDGYKIGALFAPDAGAAKTLLDACAADAQGETIYIDVPAGQMEFSDLLKQEGFERGFQTTRMYRGRPPCFDATGVFGITTLELG